MSIEDVVKDGLCTGCGSCAGICPVSAIRMREKEGVYLPQTDSSLCNSKSGCAVCYKVCPGHSIDIEKISESLFSNSERDDKIGRFIQCYTGYSADYNIRYHSSSGGAVTQLLVYMLEQGSIDGALVTRMDNESPLIPQVVLATNKEEIIQAQSSKYCPVSLNVALKEIKNKKGKFAVVGLPCHIHGFRKAEKLYPELKEKIFLYFGIYCSSGRTFYATEYLLKSRNIPKEFISHFAYRDEGWLGSAVIKLKNGEVKKYKYTDYYPKLRSFFIPYRCTLCVDHTAELADVSFGDVYVPELWDDKVGTSSIIVRSSVASDMINSAQRKGVIVLKEADRKLIIKSQKRMLDRKKCHIHSRISLIKLLGRKSPQYNLVKAGQSFIIKLRQFLSSVILYTEIFIGKRRCLWRLIKYSNYIANKLKNGE